MNFDPQTAFRRQPMVYIAIAFIIGILLSEFLNASSMIPLIALILLVLFIIIDYPATLFLLLPIALVFHLTAIP